MAPSKTIQLGFTIRHNYRFTYNFVGNVFIYFFVFFFLNFIMISFSGLAYLRVWASKGTLVLILYIFVLCYAISQIKIGFML